MSGYSDPQAGIFGKEDLSLRTLGDGDKSFEAFSFTRNRSPASTGTKVPPTSSRPLESSDSVFDTKMGIDLLKIGLDNWAKSRSYKARAEQYKGQAEVYKTQAASSVDQGEYARIEAEDKAEIKELEGDFSYGEQIIEAQKSGFFTGADSFGEGTGAGAVIKATENSYLQEAEKIRQRGERLKKQYDRNAASQRAAAAAANRASKKKKGFLGGIVSLGVAAFGGPLAPFAPLIGQGVNMIEEEVS